MGRGTNARRTLPIARPTPSSSPSRAGRLWLLYSCETSPHFRGYVGDERWPFAIATLAAARCPICKGGVMISDSAADPADKPFLLDEASRVQLENVQRASDEFTRSP